LLTTTKVTTEEEFYALRKEWQELVERSTDADIFLTWEWMSSWWSSCSADGKLYLIAFREASGKLVGIAPFQIKKDRLVGLPCRKLCFMGEPHSDRLGFLACGDRKALEKSVADILAAEKNEWDVVYLDQIDDHEYLFACLKKHGLFTIKESSALCPYLRISGTWEDYYKGLSRKFKKDMKHKYNKLERLGRWSFTVKKDPGTILGKMPELKGVEKKSRKYGSDKAFLSHESNLKFLSLLISVSSAHEWVDLSLIEVNGRIICYLLGFRYRGRYLAYNMAYDEYFHQASPGKLLLNERIKWCFENRDKIHEFDFLRGDSYIKSLWTENRRENSRIIVFKTTPYSSLLFLVYGKIRPLIKKLLKK